MLADWDALIWPNRAILEATRTQMRLITICLLISGYLGDIAASESAHRHKADYFAR